MPEILRRHVRLEKLLAVLFRIGSVSPLRGQSTETRSLKTSPVDVAAGAKIFRSHCAVCHGLQAKGDRGPDLTRGEFRHGGSDSALLRTISKGIPGTEMPGSFFTEYQLGQVVAYVRSLAVKETPVLLGNPRAGQALFAKKGGCDRCHRINGQGGRLGPDLSDVGAFRSPQYVKASILKPNEAIHPGYQRVRLTGKDGKVFAATRLNEDTYSIQVMDDREELISLLKKDLQRVDEDRNSLMPRYDGVFSNKEVDDLVAYLSSLRRKGSQ
jgi:cytochrome c oxidase cbb3-type subunit III